MTVEIDGTGWTGDGDCFQAAMLLAASLDGDSDVIDTIRVVHATVLGQGPLDGVRHWHAWVEGSFTQEVNGLTVRLTTVHDASNGRNITLPVEMYRRIGRVQQVSEYSVEEALERCQTHGHYGPWTT